MTWNRYHGPAMNDSTMNEPKQSWWRRLERRPQAHLGFNRHRDLRPRLEAQARCATLEELEELLIRADLGVDVAARIAAAIGEGRYDKQVSDDEVKAILAAEVEKVLAPVAKPLAVGAAQAVRHPGGRRQRLGQDHHHRQARGANSAPKAASVMLAAGDTFRAAAIDQLKIWGGRTGAGVIARAAGLGCGEPCVRGADGGARTTAPTC